MSMIAYKRGRSDVFIDASEFEALKQKLTGEDMRRAQRAGIRAGCRILSAQTKENFRHLRTKNRSGKGALVGYSKGGGQTVPVVKSRIRDKRKDIPPMGIVAIYARNNSIDFRAKFFELGTAERRLRRGSRRGRGVKSYYIGARRGRILPGHYFMRAKEATRSRIFGSMEKYVNGYIVRVGRRL